MIDMAKQESPLNTVTYMSGLENVRTSGGQRYFKTDPCSMTPLSQDSHESGLVNGKLHGLHSPPPNKDAADYVDSSVQFSSPRGVPVASFDRVNSTTTSFPSEHNFAMFNYSHSWMNKLSAVSSNPIESTSPLNRTEFPYPPDQTATYIPSSNYAHSRDSCEFERTEQTSFENLTRTCSPRTDPTNVNGTRRPDQTLAELTPALSDATNNSTPHDSLQDTNDGLDAPPIAQPQSFHTAYQTNPGENTPFKRESDTEGSTTLIPNRTVFHRSLADTKTNPYEMKSHELDDVDRTDEEEEEDLDYADSDSEASCDRAMDSRHVANVGNTYDHCVSSRLFNPSKRRSEMNDGLFQTHPHYGSMLSHSDKESVLDSELNSSTGGGGGGDGGNKTCIMSGKVSLLFNAMQYF
ncbi:unnamed protein product [Echinostoma caproni]|uniref:Homeobox domain-containing protein n=1 Tax=Echinostoma caproni TaxID=27848 RepID=A0A183A527_9TREM|nr:unnamed protein product [Echinostoma caproni]